WYRLLAELPLLVALIGILGTLYIDRRERDVLATTPGRNGVAAPRRPVSFYLPLSTLLAALLWVVAAHIYPQPVPWLGAAMWVALPLTLLMVQLERVNLLHTLKRFLLTYAVALLALRMAAAIFADLDLAGWAVTLGGNTELTAQAMQYTSGIVITLGLWAVLYGIPFAYGSYLFKRLTTLPVDMTAPFRTVDEILQAIRYRDADA
ncbi:MAG: hypothetical protein U9Q70_07270, partial [Chloroflexota bacterium]|nr:hypothetical protein [Chloroflexota bacterium]